MPPNALDPIVDYTHEDTGKTIIGDYIYRGNIVRGLRGLYVFADCLGPETGEFTGLIFAFRYDGQTFRRFATSQAGCFRLRSTDSISSIRHR
jgi:hypothetical protein